jgi:putative transposase
MAAAHSVDPVQLLEQHLASASPDLLREMVASLANPMMSAQVDQACGAGYGQRSDERVNRRNGYRARQWDTRVGTVELAIPKLREGSYFPDWLLTHRRRAEQALVTVVATAYLLGVSTRRVERLAEQLGVKNLSRSQVSEMAAHLDAQVKAFRERPLDAGPYTFVWADALTVKVREDGRVVNVHALIATGVNADGHREILGLDVASAEDGAGWLAFWRGLVARGLSGVQLVTADAHPGLVASSPWPTIIPRPPSTWRPPATSCWPLPPIPASCGAKSGPIIPKSDLTRKSVVAPTSSASSPAGLPSSGSSALSWPNNTTNGPKAAAT